MKHNVNPAEPAGYHPEYLIHRGTLAGFVAALFAIVTMAVLTAAPAGAASLAPDLLTQFGEDCVMKGEKSALEQCNGAAGETQGPGGIATDPNNGHVLVVDGQFRRIDEFTPWGNFVKAWGWDVVASGPGDDASAPEDQFEICVPASGDACKPGTAGAGTGQLNFSQGVAVDSEGGVYVFDRDTHRVQKFDSEGHFLLAWGGDVVAHGPGDSANDEEQELVVAATSGSFKLSFEDPFGGGETSQTPSLLYDATAAEVQTALNALPTIAGNGGSVTVSGGPGDATGSAAYVVSFEGNLGGDDVPQLQIDRANLGPATIGARLICSTTTEAATVQYGWLRNGTPISGASSASYTTTAADEGKAIQCQIFAVNPNAAVTQVANPVYVAPPEPGIEPPVAPKEIEAPSTQGNLDVGTPGGPSLSCDPREENWVGASSFSYRWYRNGVEIPGASGKTYVTTAADLASPAVFQCAVIASNAGGAAAMVSRVSSGSGVTRPAPDPSAPGVEFGEVTASMEPVLTMNQGGAPEVCRQAAGDVCKAGNTGAANGQFAAPPRFAGPGYIATGPEDVIYVGDRERIQKFDSDGTYKSQVAVPGETVRALAVAPSGNLYATYYWGEGGAANVKPNIRQLSPSGSPICTIKVKSPTALATDSAGDVYFFSPEAFGEPQEIPEYDASCEPVTSFGHGEFKASFGIATNAVGDVYVSNSGQASYIRAYGPGPVSFEPPPPADPVIVSQYANLVGADYAELGVQINPHFWNDTTYYVQFGEADCATSVCAEQPAPPGALLSEKSINAAVSGAPVKLSGLKAGTTYHYRFVAVSGGGGPVYGPDRSFRTYADAAPTLPDKRVHELVSPAAKGGGEVGVPTAAGGGAELTAEPLQASPSGDAITYTSFTSFGEDPESAPAASQYLSRRGAQVWSTDNINPRFEEGFTRDPLVGFSSDLSHAAVIALEPELTEDAAVDVPNIYQRDNLSGALTAITTAAQQPQISPSLQPYEYCLFYGGASADSKRVFFGAKGALLAGDPVAAGFNLYEWSAVEGLRLVSVLPDESAAAPNSSTSFGHSAGTKFGACDPSIALLRHAVSADGTRVIWSYAGAYAGIQNPLFARVGGTETIQLDAPNTGVAGKGGAGEYWDAAAGGSAVFFTDAKKLTKDSTASSQFPDLYRYDFGKEAGKRLDDLSVNKSEAADVQGLIGASEDGSYAYFVAHGVLSALPNAEGDTAIAAKNNLYAWHEGEGVRFLATLGQADSDDWTNNPTMQTARVSLDGRHLAFISAESLSGFENIDLSTGKADAEVFLYDYEADALACASCNAAGTRPLGPATVPTWSTPYEQPRYLSEGGTRLFFESLDALDPHDANEKRDVYEFEASGAGSCTEEDPTYNPASGGCVYLISSGTNKDESYFLDASSSGSDAFISSREGLVFYDEDGRYDVYDARVEGNPPPPPSEICEGESCRGAGTGAPPPSAPGSGAFEGPRKPHAQARLPQRPPRGAQSRQDALREESQKTAQTSHPQNAEDEPMIAKILRATLALAALGASLAATPALGAEAEPAWSVISIPTPTAFVPGDTKGSYSYGLRIANVGGASTDASDITITDTLPAGLAVKGVSMTLRAEFSGGQFHTKFDYGAEACETEKTGEVETVTCTISEALSDGEEPALVAPGEERIVTVKVQTPETAGEGETLTNQLEVQGGGAPAASISADNITSSLDGEGDPLPAPGGITHFHPALIGLDGQPVGQAGSHPFQYIPTSFAVNTNPAPPGSNTELVPAGGDLKDIGVTLPGGLAANPNAALRCSAAEFAAIQTIHLPGGFFSANHCPDGSAVGMVLVQGIEGGSNGFLPVPLYNLVPPPGMPAQLGFQTLGLPFFIDTELRPDKDYRVVGVLRNLTQVKRLTASTVVMWGTPADPRHDALRGVCLNQLEIFPISLGDCPAGIAMPKPLFRLPTQCSSPLDTELEISNWTTPAEPFAKTEVFPTPSGCNQLDFEPSLQARPTTDVADSPSGLQADLHLPQNEDSEGLGTADLRKAVVTLPKGIAINPSSANGLDACSPAQVGLASSVGAAPVRFTADPANCPAAARIGSAEVDAPAVDHTLKGGVYVATPHQNPFGSLLAIYIAVHDPKSGVVLKLAGQVEADPLTGQLTTTFDEAPQQPFEDFRLDFFGGAGAALRTPATCGTYSTTSSLTPWSAPESGPPATPSDTYQVNKAPGGGSCPTSAAALPNAPAFDAGTIAPIARAYSPAVIELRRADGSQEFSSVTVTPPPGLLGKLAGIPYCPDSALAAAEGKTGNQEKQSPSCPAASQVGSVTVGAGAGPAPYYTQGSAYLSGPYKTAPLSLAIVTPATAGPYDLGTVVSRVALDVNPETAQITATSDKIPHILQGIPLDVRSIAVRLDRPNFTINPTNCDPMAFAGLETSILGQGASLARRFQVAECGALAFKPKLSLRLTGKTNRGAHPALRATLTMPEGGANIARATVALPKSEFIEQAHFQTICTRVQYAAKQCPAGSVYGHVVAFSPLLEAPLAGPVYLRASAHKLPDLVFSLDGQIHFDAVGKVDSVRGGVRTTFEAVPDAPVSKLVLTMAGGKKGLFVNSTDICKGTNRAITEFDGQNGKVADSRPPLKAQCKGKGKKHHKSHRAKRAVR